MRDLETGLKILLILFVLLIDIGLVLLVFYTILSKLF
jgi:hypothetical protein